MAHACSPPVPPRNPDINEIQKKSADGEELTAEEEKELENYNEDVDRINLIFSRINPCEEGAPLSEQDKESLKAESSSLYKKWYKRAP